MTTISHRESSKLYLMNADDARWLPTLRPSQST